MATQTVRLDSFHTAALDPITGYGLLALPLGAENVWLGAESVHATAWDAVVRQLAGNDWEPIEDEWGCPMIEGTTASGRTLVALMHLDPIISDDSMAQLAESGGEVLSTARGL